MLLTPDSNRLKMYIGLFLVHLSYPEQIATSLVMFDFGDLLKITVWEVFPGRAKIVKPRHKGLKDQFCTLSFIIVIKIVQQQVRRNM